MSKKITKSLGSNWLIVIIGLIASCISLIIFITGKQSLNLYKKNEAEIPTIAYPTPTETLAPEVEEILTGATEYAERLLSLSKTEPSSWFPNQEDFPEHLYLDADTSLSNENASKLFPDSSTMYRNFQSWGRITGHRKIYYDELQCDQIIGLAYVEIQSSLYSSPDGADQMYDYYSHEYNNGAAIGSVQLEESLPLGENGLMAQYNEKNPCTQEVDGYRTATVVFKRQVAFIYIKVSAISYTISDDDIQSIAMNLAQYIDLKLLAASK